MVMISVCFVRAQPPVNVSQVCSKSILDTIQANLVDCELVWIPFALDYTFQSTE